MDRKMVKAKKQYELAMKPSEMMLSTSSKKRPCPTASPPSSPLIQSMSTMLDMEWTLHNYNRSVYVASTKKA